MNLCISAVDPRFGYFYCVSIMTKRVVRFFIFGAGIVLLGVGVLFGIRSGGYFFSAEYRATREAERFLKEWEEKYEQDSYGGATPEETLFLFIAALKNDDTDLAAKYFIVDAQEQWHNDLLEIKERGLLEAMVRDLENRQVEQVEDTTARYFLIGNDGLSSPLVLIKSPDGIWKIRTL